MLSIECTLETKSNQSFKTSDSCLLQNCVIAFKAVILSILNKYNSSLLSSIGPIPKTMFCNFIIFDFLKNILLPELLLSKKKKKHFYFYFILQV